MWSHGNQIPMFGITYDFWRKLDDFLYHQSIYSLQGYSTFASSSLFGCAEFRYVSVNHCLFDTSLWALDRWERRFLKGSLCAGQPFMFVISFILFFLHQCLCSNSLLGFCEHCYMFYLESCAIGQIPKIVSFAGTETRLFLNGIFGCHMVSLGPYFKVSNFLTVDTDLYHSLRLSLWTVPKCAGI